MSSDIVIFPYIKESCEDVCGHSGRLVPKQGFGLEGWIDKNRSPLNRTECDVRTVA